jgi:hypothetical protein
MYYLKIQYINLFKYLHGLIINEKINNNKIIDLLTYPI